MAILTSLGKASVGASGFTTWLYFAVGSGTQTEAASVTALSSEITRVALQGISIAGGVLTASAFIPPGATSRSIAEWGIFTASSGGNCQFYDTQTAVTQAITDPDIWDISIAIS